MSEFNRAIVVNYKYFKTFSILLTQNAVTTHLDSFSSLMLCQDLMTHSPLTLSSSNALENLLSLVLPKSRSYILLSFDILLDILQQTHKRLHYGLDLHQGSQYCLQSSLFCQLYHTVSIFILVQIIKLFSFSVNILFQL